MLYNYGIISASVFFDATPKKGPHEKNQAATPGSIRLLTGFTGCK